MSHAVPAAEFSCADSVGVKPSDGLQLLVTEGRVALAELHAGATKRGADGLHVHAEFRRDLLLRRSVAVGDDDAEYEVVTFAGGVRWRCLAHLSRSPDSLLRQGGGLLASQGKEQGVDCASIREGVKQDSRHCEVCRLSRGGRTRVGSHSPTIHHVDLLAERNLAIQIPADTGVCMTAKGFRRRRQERRRSGVLRGKNELVSSRPNGIIKFSNGAAAPFGYDVSVDLEEVAGLTCAQVIADITRSVEEQGALSDGPQSLFVQMQGADQRFGLDLGYGRFTPYDNRPGRDSFSLYLDTGEVSVVAYYPVLRNRPEIEETLRASMAHTQFEVARVDFGESDGQLYCDVDLRVPSSTPLSLVAEACQLVLALLFGGKPTPDSPVSAFQALASGRWDVLLNMTENIWFEAKGAMYGLADTRQRFEFALDVASFANSTLGGLIVVGLETFKDEHGRDVVSDTRGRPQLAASVSRLEDIIHQMIHPHPRGLSIAVFHRDDRDLLAILIPPQLAEAQPFLVSGAPVADGKIYGGGFTWVERRGSSKRNVSMSDVHNLLRGGHDESARTEFDT